MLQEGRVVPNAPPNGMAGQDSNGHAAVLGQEEVVVAAQRKRIVAMLLKGSIYGQPGSDGTRWGNFRQWAKNQHPVLSMFFAHELHPFTGGERFSVLVCYLCWAFFITIFFTASLGTNDICELGCDDGYTTTSGVEMCGTGNNSSYPENSFNSTGASDNDKPHTLEEWEAGCDSILAWYWLSFVIAACTVPYSTILQVLATCGCVQNWPTCLQKCFEAMGSCILKLFGVLSVVWLSLGIRLAVSLDGGMFIASYAVGVVKSWLYWPFIAGLMFNWKYKKQRRLFEEENPGKIAMAWPVSMQSADVEIAIGRSGQPVAYQSPPQSPTLKKGNGLLNLQLPGTNGMGGATPMGTPTPQQATRIMEIAKAYENNPMPQYWNRMVYYTGTSSVDGEGWPTYLFWRFMPDLLFAGHQHFRGPAENGMPSQQLHMHPSPDLHKPQQQINFMYNQPGGSPYHSPPQSPQHSWEAAHAHHSPGSRGPSSPSGPSPPHSPWGGGYGFSQQAQQGAHFSSSLPGVASEFGGGESGATLPLGWEIKSSPDGRPLYIDHNSKTTHWDPPVMHLYHPQQQQQQQGFVTSSAFVSQGMAGAHLAPPPYAPMVPAVPVRAPAPTFMEIELGHDQFGGDVIEVTYPSGQTARVKLPPKTCPGDRIQIPLP